jgi:hypothetical protein
MNAIVDNKKYKLVVQNEGWWCVYVTTPHGMRPCTMERTRAGAIATAQIHISRHPERYTDCVIP